MIDNTIKPHLEAHLQATQEKFEIPERALLNKGQPLVLNTPRRLEYTAIPLNALMAYGQDTLLETDRNYMTEISGPKPMDHAFYLAPSKNVLQHLQQVVHAIPESLRRSLTTAFAGPLKTMNPIHGGLMRISNISLSTRIQMKGEMPRPQKPFTVKKENFPKF